MNRSLSTYCQTIPNATHFGPIVGFTSSGKERDAETGLSYFGARYYDADLLTGWLSVDPMADKYPGLSPYGYCAWNPIRLVDPDGRIIDSTSITQSISDLLNPNNKSYQPQFAEIVSRLSEDKETIYSFNQVSSTACEDNLFNTGSLTCLGKNDQGQALVSINYADTYPQFYISGSIFGVSCNYSLYEETYHAIQFLEGSIGFAQKEVGGPWQSFACDIYDEFDAKRFAQKLSPNVSDIGILKTMEDESFRFHISICYPNLPKHPVSAKSALNKISGFEHISTKEQLPTNIIMNF